jgi:CHAT domain-containing protein
VRRGAPLRFVDLGEAARVDEEVTTLRRDLSDPSRDPKATSRALDARIMAKIRPLLGDARALYLSPDGALNLVPFAALVDDGGKFLIEKFQITYVSSGRELTRQSQASGAPTPAILVGAPAYEDVGDGARAPEGQRKALRFSKLPGTAEEVAALEKIVPDAVVMTGAAASERGLKEAARPIVLHVATHGFFLAGDHQAIAGARALEFDAGGAEAPAAADPWQPPGNPLLRSGLALAGANERVGRDDGILTALEVASMDLRGTELVVLSACETGLGEVEGGEGVYGLRRALAIAGARSQVMSLWKVDDAATRDLMVRYYEALRAGGGRSAALREVALGMLASKTRAHPFYWASFIVSGNDGPLEAASGATPRRSSQGRAAALARCPAENAPCHRPVKRLFRSRCWRCWPPLAERPGSVRLALGGEPRARKYFPTGCNPKRPPRALCAINLHKKWFDRWVWKVYFIAQARFRRPSATLREIPKELDRAVRWCSWPIGRSLPPRPSPARRSRIRQRRRRLHPPPAMARPRSRG